MITLDSLNPLRQSVIVCQSVASIGSPLLVACGLNCTAARRVAILGSPSAAWSYLGLAVIWLPIALDC